MPYLFTVTADPYTGDQLQRIFALEREYVFVFVQDGQSALQHVGREAERIDLILVDDRVQGLTPLELTRKLAILAPQIPILVLADESNVEYVREALLAGARAFIMKPLRDADVVATVQQILLLEEARRGRQQANGSGPRGRVITVASPKGGTGKTMLAANLAVALRERTQQSVILVDGQASLGDLDVALNLQVKYTCADILPRAHALDGELLGEVLTEHVSGVQVLASSPDVEDIDRMSPELFENLLRGLQSQADFLIVDAGALSDPVTAVALEAAEQVLLVVTPEVPCLRRLVLFLAAAERNHFPTERLHFVLNREGMAGGLYTDDVREYVKGPLRSTLPDDPALVTYSLNRGIPLVTSSPRSVLARRIRELAASYAEDGGTEGAVETQGGGLLKRLATIWANGESRRVAD